MGVQLPNFADLGYADPRAAGTLPVYPQEDPGAQGLAVLGKGVQAAGGAAEDFAAESQRKKDKLDEAMATVDLFNRLTPLHAQIAKETDPAKVAELRGQYDTLLETSGGAIGNPMRRQLWTATHAKTIAQAQADADTRNTGLGRDQAVADIWRQRDDAVRNAVASDDPMAIPNAQMAIDGLGKYAGDYGALDPKQKYLFDKQSQNQLYEGRADRLIQLGKADEAKTFLEANRDKIDPVALERLQIRADAKGRKNNTDGVALEALGLPSVGVGSLPPGDSKAATEHTLDLIEKHESGGRNIMQQVVGPGGGLNPSTGTVTGPSSAQGNFQITNSTWKQFAPEAGVSVDQFPNAMAAPYDIQRQVARTILTSPNGGGVQHWANFNSNLKAALTSEQPGNTAPPQLAQSRTGLPSLTDAYMNILRNPRVKDAQDVRDAFATATAVHNAMEADASRAERIQQQRQKQAMEQRENAIWADVYGPNPQVTASQVAVDPAFNANPERRKAMIELINNPPGSGVPATQSYAAALSLIDRIRLPEGSPDKITDEGQIYPLMRSMNRTDFDYVRKTLNDIRAPGGEALAKEEDRFFKDVGPYIDKSNPLAGAMDPAGKARLYEYHRWVDQKKDELKKAGKNPNDLFDPASSSYVGKPEIISYYQPTLAQSQASLKDFATGVPKPLAPLAPWNPPPIPESFTTGGARQSGESVEDYLKRTGQQ